MVAAAVPVSLEELIRKEQDRLRGRPENWRDRWRDYWRGVDLMFVLLVTMAVLWGAFGLTLLCWAMTEFLK